MDMSDRQKEILCALIEEYTKTGTPVGSRILYQKYDFGVSSALIRAELHELMGFGYLSQPHTSGGRVPTDKGLRFFISVLQQTINDARLKIRGRYAERTVEDMIGSTFKEMVETMAEFTRALGVGYGFEPPEVYKKGLDELMGCMHFQTWDEMIEVAHDFEDLDARMDDVRDMLSEARENPVVFVGKESPFTKSSSLSIIMNRYALADGQGVVMMIVGPRRMDYRKNLILMKMMGEKLQ